MDSKVVINLPPQKRLKPSQSLPHIYIKEQSSAY